MKSSAGIVNVAENVPISVSELPKKENVFLSVKNTEVNRTHNKSSKDLTLLQISLPKFSVSIC